MRQQQSAAANLAADGGQHSQHVCTCAGVMELLRSYAAIGYLGWECVLISFIQNLGVTIKPIKGPPQGVYACPHNGLPLVGLTPDVCVCFLSLSMTVVSPDAQRHSSSWNRRSRAAGGGGSCCTAGDGGSSPGGDDASLPPRFGAGVQPPSPSSTVATAAGSIPSSCCSCCSCFCSCSCNSFCAAAATAREEPRSRNKLLPADLS
jgi:hypothetical protein